MSERTISDGFGSTWALCDRDDCGLQVVRPGKVQCDCDWDDHPRCIAEGCDSPGTISGGGHGGPWCHGRWFSLESRNPQPLPRRCPDD